MTIIIKFCVVFCFWECIVEGDIRISFKRVFEEELCKSQGVASGMRNVHGTLWIFLTQHLLVMLSASKEEGDSKKS